MEKKNVKKEEKVIVVEKDNVLEDFKKVGKDIKNLSDDKNSGNCESKIRVIFEDDYFVSNGLRGRDFVNILGYSMVRVNNVLRKLVEIKFLNRKRGIDGYYYYRNNNNN